MIVVMEANRLMLMKKILTLLLSLCARGGDRI